jgi:hypothetical protein
MDNFEPADTSMHESEYWDTDLFGDPTINICADLPSSGESNQEYPQVDRPIPNCDRSVFRSLEDFDFDLATFDTVPIDGVSPRHVQNSTLEPEQLTINPALIGGTTPPSNINSPKINVPGAQFRNKILNSFKKLSGPLRVLDRFHYPFEEALEQELQIQIQKYQEQEMERELQTELQRHQAEELEPAIAYAIEAEVNQEELEQNFNSQAPKNKRPINIHNLDPSQFYLPLQETPRSWGSIDPATGMHLFRYTPEGELLPQLEYTVSQITEYLSTHPLHQIRGTKNSGLIFQVQITPADSSKRYPHKGSNKCRFASCPVTNHTIHKGEFRVAFDEQSHIGYNSDPFHNAGYVHLFCLEKFLNFPQLCKDFNICPDDRVLPEGKNKMAVTRDRASMKYIVDFFVVNSLPWDASNRMAADYYQYTLNYALTLEHLQKQPKHWQSIREKRGGNSIDIHLNNLDVYVARERIIRDRKSAEAKANRRVAMTKTYRKRKVNRGEREDEESGLDEDILKRESCRPVKRARQ